jgi:hypothetical protein
MAGAFVATLGVRGEWFPLSAWIDPARRTQTWLHRKAADCLREHQASMMELLPVATTSHIPHFHLDGQVLPYPLRDPDTPLLFGILTFMHFVQIFCESC